MAVLYPESLPSPLAKSINVRRQDTKRRIEFDAKNSRTTNHASNAPTIIDCQFIVEAAQVDAFDYFLKVTSNSMANWIYAAWIAALGFSDHYFRFIDIPEIKKSNGAYVIRAALEMQVKSLTISPVKAYWEVSNISVDSILSTEPGFWAKADEDTADYSGTLDISNFSTGLDFISGKRSAVRTVYESLPAYEMYIHLDFASLSNSWSRNFQEKNKAIQDNDDFTICTVISRNSAYLVGVIRFNGQDWYWNESEGNIVKISSAGIEMNQVALSAASLSLQNRDVVILKRAGAFLSLFVNGALIATQAARTMFYRVDNYIGATAHQGFSPTFANEVIAWNRAIDNADAISISENLKNKWQIE